MENSRPEEKNIIKHVRNLFRWEKLRNQINDTIIKDIKNSFRVEKENKALKTE